MRLNQVRLIDGVFHQSAFFERRKTETSRGRFPPIGKALFPITVSWGRIWMGLWETVLLGIGLSMDAVAVTVANSMAYRCKTREKVLMPLFFGGFQGLMPLLGYFAGGLFASYIHRFAGGITFLVLGYIGAKMLWEGLRSTEETVGESVLTVKMLFLQAIATSIDAFAVGVSLLAIEAEIVPASAVIAATTFLCSLAALFVGKRFGEELGNKAKVFGGIILLLIAVRAVL